MARDPDGAQINISRRAMRRQRRRSLARLTMIRMIGTAATIGIGVLLGWILRSSDVAGWTIGLIVALVATVLTLVLWVGLQRK